MTNIRISKNSACFAFFALVTLMPAYIVNQSSIIKMLSNVVAVCMALYIFKEKLRLSQIGIAVAIYYLYLMANTYLHGQGEIHFLISTAKMLFFIVVVDIMLAKHYEKAVSVLYVVFVAITILDVISIFLFPNGLYQTTTIWNQWSSSSIEGWLLGNKNNHALWYLVAIYLSYIKQRITGLKKNKVIWYFVMFVTLVAVIRMQSSTSMIVIIIMDIGMLYFQFRRNQKIHINMITVGITYVIFQVLILMGSANFLQPIITKLFGKDLTFSGRVTAWMNVSLYIFQKPVFGWGKMTGESSRSLLGNAAFVNSHNQWLQTLWEGGIIQLILLFIVFGVMVKQIQRCRERVVTDISKIVFIVMLIAMAFEVELGSLVSWVLIVLCYHTSIYFSERKKEREILV